MYTVPKFNNAQEIFDFVVTHLAKQGCRSVGTYCLYRGPNKTMCAFGCLIPDNLYQFQMEKNRVRQLFNEYTELKDLYGDYEYLLVQLQDAHDTKFNNIVANLQFIAKKFDLNTNVLDSLTFPTEWV